MANTGNSDKWYFTKEQLENTPSKKCGFDDYKELQYRQQAANFIQDMGQRLKVSQLCINTAIVYMHRFYVFHSFTNFPWHQMAAAALFLAAKVEEQPRKLEYVIRVANICKNPRDTSFDINSERYIAQSQDLVFNENVLLQTLGFDVAIDHPHTYVVRCCHLVRASKDLAQTSYFMASNSLHLTTMCIQYKPTVVACFCILLACKWSNWEIPLSNEKKEWYTYVDSTVTAELLQQLTSEFLVIFENCPSRLKEKIMAKQESSGSPFEQDRKQESGTRSLEFKGDDPHKHRSRPHEASASGHRSQEQREREYKERKEKEKMAHMSGITLPHQSHHHRPERPPVDPKLKLHSRPPPNTLPYPPNSRIEPRDILREAAKDSPFGIPAIRDSNREHMKDSFAARSDKEVPKRDPLLKPNVQTDPNSLTNYSDVRQQRIDPSRSRIEPSKSASKQDMMRRHDEQKPHIKSETDNIKKHLSSSFDKNSAYLKSSSSTSQKIKSPFSVDNKSVPKTSSSQAGAHPKAQFNGNTNGSYNKLPSQDTELKIKTEPLHIKEEKEEIPTPAFIKRPSLFSPEKTPPQIKLEKSELTKASSLTSLTALSPINSPPCVPNMRNRNYSSSSEPELRPTMKKIDQVEGFENLMRDSTIGMANIPCITDRISTENEPISPLKDANMSPSMESIQTGIVNGLETNPALISNLLKEAASASHLPGVATTSIKTEPVEPNVQNCLEPPEHKEKEHHHHKSKKKKEKHKHRDKDKNREEKEKKKKHKDKDREKHKHRERKESVDPQPLMSEPIKIKIQRDKIQPLNEGLKIKIPKDKIKTDGIVDPLPQPSTGGLKIKIPKEMITNCNTSSGHSINSDEISFNSSSTSRKRERERSSPNVTPPLKLSKLSHRDSKQNGRHSYSKVSKNQPSSCESFANIAQVDSSFSENSAVAEKPSCAEIVLPGNNVPFEENNNENMIKEVTGNTTGSKEPSTPKYVSSTVEMVSPTPLSPLSPISSIHEADSHLNIMPLSPISESTSPFFLDQTQNADLGYSSNASFFDSENLALHDQLKLDKTSNLSSQMSNKPIHSKAATPSGNSNIFSMYDQNTNIQPRSTPPNYTNKSTPPCSQKSSSLQWHNTNDPPPIYQTSQTMNSSIEDRKPPPYISTPYKLVNHGSSYKRNVPQFSKQKRNSKYENFEFSSYNPPYHSKGQRGYNAPPRYPSRGSANHQPHLPNLPPSYHVPPPQNQDNQIQYSTAPPQLPYNPYQVAPPTMPNMNVPPPTYGLYPSYFGGYMYPEMYQQPVAGFGNVNQPPLPAEAPPADVPPPPPPE